MLCACGLLRKYCLQFLSDHPYTNGNFLRAYNFIRLAHALCKPELRWLPDANLLLQVHGCKYSFFSILLYLASVCTVPTVYQTLSFSFIDKSAKTSVNDGSIFNTI